VNGAAANAALGAPGITQGDMRADEQILIDDLNAHGGIAGRKIVPVFHAVDATSNDTADARGEAICADFTQDHHVFVAFTGSEPAAMLTCLMKAGVVVVQDDLSLADSQTFTDNPYYVMVSELSIDRLARTEVSALSAQDYFSGWDPALGAARPTKGKVGVITWDLPAFVRTTKNVLVPALAKAGYPPDAADTVYIAPPQRTSDEGAAAAAVSNAVLKFRSDGVDHVIVFDSSALLTLFFLENAQSQHYFPRYGVSSQNGPQALLDSGAVQKEQLRGSVGIGFVPVIDITPSEDPDSGPLANDSRRRCIKLMTDHGQKFSDANAEAVALTLCNVWWFTRDVFNHAGGALNRAGFLKAVSALGTSFESGLTFGTRFSDTQHDGASMVRYYGYDEACGCMHYRGGNIPTS
jgi:hypothetical protein